MISDWLWAQCAGRACARALGARGAQICPRASFLFCLARTTAHEGVSITFSPQDGNNADFGAGGVSCDLDGIDLFGPLINEALEFHSKVRAPRARAHVHARPHRTTHQTSFPFFPPAFSCALLASAAPWWATCPRAPRARRAFARRRTRAQSSAGCSTGIRGAGREGRPTLRWVS